MGCVWVCLSPCICIAYSTHLTRINMTGKLWKTTTTEQLKDKTIHPMKRTERAMHRTQWNKKPLHCYCIFTNTFCQHQNKCIAFSLIRWNYKNLRRFSQRITFVQLHHFQFALFTLTLSLSNYTSFIENWYLKQRCVFARQLYELNAIKRAKLFDIVFWSGQLT